MGDLLKILSSFLIFLQQHFFPSFVFVIVNQLIFVPIFSHFLSQRGITKIILPSDLFANLALAVIVALVLGYSLENLNLRLIDFFEGRSFRYHSYGKWLTEKQKRFRDWLVGKVDELENQLHSHREEFRRQASGYSIGSTEREKLYQELLERESELVTMINYYRKKLDVGFPRSEDLIMPTRLGNIIAASNDYAVQRYGIDAVTLWPRMLPLLTRSGYDNFVRQAKGSIDFFLDLCVFSAILSIEFLLAALIGASHLSLMGVLLFVLLAYGFYRLAAAGAIAYGQVIRAAFDLFRYDLLSDLYGESPTNYKDEKALWLQLSQFIREGGISPVMSYSRIKNDIQKQSREKNEDRKMEVESAGGSA